MCGIVGAYSIQGENVMPAVSIAAQKLQNRGGHDVQGVGIYDGHNHERRHETAYQFFPRIAKQRGRKSPKAVAGLRYATEGKRTSHSNIPPLEVEAYGWKMYIAHNGNIPYSGILRGWLEANGYHHSATNDTESLGAFLLKQISEKGVKDGVQEAIKSLDDAACSVVAMLPDEDLIFAFRDKHGYRPLSMHWDEDRGMCAFASENPALDNNAFLNREKASRELIRGELVIVNRDGVSSYTTPNVCPELFCSFEDIYFARPDSTLRGLEVAYSRSKLGEALWRLNPIEGDFIVVPDSESGKFAAQGFAKASGSPYFEATPKERYPVILPNGISLNQRGFLASEQAQREFIAANRLLLEKFVRNKRVAYITDCIVRGTTIIRNLSSFAEMGADSIDVGATYMPIIYPCHWGIDYRRVRELAARDASSSSTGDINQMMLEKANAIMRGRLKVNSWTYMTKEGLQETLGKGICMKCLGVGFDGRVTLPDFLKEFAGQDHIEML